MSRRDWAAIERRESLRYHFRQGVNDVFFGRQLTSERLEAWDATDSLGAGAYSAGVRLAERPYDRLISRLEACRCCWRAYAYRRVPIAGPVGTLPR